MNSRSVSFVDRLELEFSGNHFCHALALGDVDGDGLNEFIIGNVDGNLCIYKGENSKRPWKKSSGLGTITCVGTGDIFNSGKIQLICINAIGMCYIFSVYSTRSSSGTSLDSSLQPVHTQNLPANVRVLLVAGIAPDNKEELFIGHTDRGLHVYRWDTENSTLVLKYTFNLQEQIGSLSVTMTTNSSFQLLVSQVGGTYVPLMYSECSAASEIVNNKEVTIASDGGGVDHRKLDKDSIGISLSLEESNKDTKGKKRSRTNSKDKDTQSPLLPERIFKQHSSSTSSSTGNASKQSLSSSKGTTPNIYTPCYKLELCPVVGQVQKRSPSSLTEVVGDLHSRESLTDSHTHSNIVGLCSLDGCIRFMKDEQKMWEHLVDHNLFAIAKLDITNDGNDEIITCSWDGSTYIFDHSRNVVKYKFEDNVCAFCAGYFGFSTEHNKPCLIYSTFFNKIYIYHNITLPSISPSNLMITLKQKEFPEFIMKHLQNMTDEEKRDLMHKALYGQF